MSAGRRGLRGVAGSPHHSLPSTSSGGLPVPLCTQALATRTLLPNLKASLEAPEVS